MAEKCKSFKILESSREVWVATLTAVMEALLRPAVDLLLVLCVLLQDNHYRPEGSPGCLLCDCYPLGSFSRACERDRGQCQCKPGVIGRQCDRCDNPFAEVSANGCEGWGRRGGVSVTLRSSSSLHLCNK